MKSPNVDIRDYDKGADRWFDKVHELTGMDFIALDERRLDPYGAYDRGMSPEDFAKEVSNGNG